MRTLKLAASAVLILGLLSLSACWWGRYDGRGDGRGHDEQRGAEHGDRGDGGGRDDHHGDEGHHD